MVSEIGIQELCELATAPLSGTAERYSACQALHLCAIPPFLTFLFL